MMLCCLRGLWLHYCSKSDLGFVHSDTLGTVNSVMAQEAVAEDEIMEEGNNEGTLSKVFQILENDTRWFLTKDNLNCWGCGLWYEWGYI